MGGHRMSREFRTCESQTLTNYLNREGLRDDIIDFGIESFERFGRGLVMVSGDMLTYRPASAMEQGLPGTEHIDHINQSIVV
jgi:hypothetical protein